MTRKAQQSCREQPETPSSASATPQGEVIRNDNKDKSQQKCSGGGTEDRRQSNGQDAATTSTHPTQDTSLSASVRGNTEEEERRRITPQGPNPTQPHRQIHAPPLFSLQRLSQERAHTPLFPPSRLNTPVPGNLQHVGKGRLEMKREQNICEGV